MSQQTFDRMMSNPLYAGILRVDEWNVNTVGTFEPIVEPAMFEPRRTSLPGAART
ncbi:MAG: hypothetical protein H0T48_09115 [Gemmatimonadaceae bacterium]|nr:hypothetical protein [Gemmatimonadaceae bacterium]